MELTEGQQKGLDIMVRVLSKKYPFIIGVSPNMNDFEDYSTLFTLRLIISKSKIKDYFKQKLDNRWDEFWRIGNIFHSNPDPDDFIIEDIKNLGRMFHEVMTDEYKFKSSLDRRDFRRVQINSFILR